MNTAALIIDCWEDTYVASGIIQHLQTNTDITVVIVATYNKHPPLNPRLAVDETDSKLVKYLSTRTDPVLNIVHYKKLKRAIRQHSISTISVMGAAWLECVHHRPVGILALQQLPVRVIVNPNCVQIMNMLTGPTMLEQISQDPNWTQLGNDFLMRRT